MLRFVQIGFLVLIIDYSIYTILNIYLDFLFSRLISYIISTYVAWILNSNFTFQQKKGSPQKYFFYSFAAGFQNIILSSILSFLFGRNHYLDLFFVSIGSFYGLIFNYYFQSQKNFK
jgi:putative flippase GtrA